jgi:hypothetical protein
MTLVRYLFTMSTAKFLDKIKGLKLTQFKFNSFTKEVSNPNDEKNGERMTYLVLELDQPIPLVQSSLTEYMPKTNERINDRKEDVTHVRCSLETIEKYADEFTFEEDTKGDLTRAGSYAGDLFLDLSRAREVWLTDTKFSKLSGDFKLKNRVEKLQNMMKSWKSKLETTN